MGISSWITPAEFLEKIKKQRSGGGGGGRNSDNLCSK